jgi:hypothetical protein
VKILSLFYHYAGILLLDWLTHMVKIFIRDHDPVIWQYF